MNRLGRWSNKIALLAAWINLVLFLRVTFIKEIEVVVFVVVEADEVTTVGLMITVEAKEVRSNNGHPTFIISGRKGTHNEFIGNFMVNLHIMPML